MTSVIELYNSYTGKEQKRKRARDVNSVDILEGYVLTAPPQKRFAQPFADIPERSPCTPESGIDMTDSTPSTSSPYYVTTSGGHTICCDDISSSMDLKPEQSRDNYTLYIVDEPEENYRARYESEGCRGPMKGRNGSCPTVMITSSEYGCFDGEVNVELTTNEGIPLQSCRLDSTDEGTNLKKKIHVGEKAIFDNLRIRRLKKTESTSKGASLSKGPKGRCKHDEKQAHLLFTATIKTDSKIIVLKALSQPIYLNANHDPPEIHRVVPQFGTTGDYVALIGTRMHSPRVSFILPCGPDGRQQEINADIEKEVSHQNALVIKVPQFPPTVFLTSNIAQVRIRVTAGKGDRSGKEPLHSNLWFFTTVKQGLCKECCISNQLSHFPPRPSTTTFPQMGPVFHSPTTMYGSCTVGGGVMIKPQSSQPVIMSPPHISSRVPTPVPVSPISSMGNQTPPLPATIAGATPYTPPLHTISTIPVEQEIDIKKIIDDLYPPKSTGGLVSSQPSPYPVTYSSVISSEEPTFVQAIPDPMIGLDISNFTTDSISTSTTTQADLEGFGRYLPRTNFQPLSTAPHTLPGEYPASYNTGCMPRSLGSHYTQTS